MKRSMPTTANRPARLDIEQMRLITKVARLHYIHGERQAEIAEKMAIAVETEKRINISRESYRKVAGRGALMFFMLSELNKMHTFHHYSLNSFIIVFQTAVTGKRTRVTWSTTGNALLDMILPKKRKGLFGKINLKKVIASNQSPEELQKRLDYLLENITYQVFNFSRRGLFDRHKLILATQLTIKVLSREGKLKDSEVAFLLSGPGLKANSPPMTTQVALYISEAQWSGVFALVAIVEPLKPLIDDLEQNFEAWKEWVESELPEDKVQGQLPGEWEKKLSLFQRLLLIRVMRPDRVTAAMAGLHRPAHVQHEGDVRGLVRAHAALLRALPGRRPRRRH